MLVKYRTAGNINEDTINTYVSLLIQEEAKWIYESMSYFKTLGHLFLKLLFLNTGCHFINIHLFVVCVGGCVPTSVHACGCQRTICQI